MKHWLKKGISFILAGFLCLSLILNANISVSYANVSFFDWETFFLADVPSLSFSQLPTEAKHTLSLIERGGPFPYPEKDGSIFYNRERLLPNKPKGYYREYTVPTSGQRDRGARRLILGQRGEIYYTSDHYKSFYRVQRR